MKTVNPNSFKVIRGNNFKSSDQDVVICGYAAVYSHLLNYKQNSMALPGAFKNLDSSNLALIWDLNPCEPIGKILQVFEDLKKGLYYKAKLILAVQRAREIYSLLKCGVSMNSAVLYIEQKSVMDKKIYAESGLEVFSSIWLASISLCSRPLYLADEATIAHCDE